MTRQRGRGYVAALVARLGGDVTITDEEAARAGELLIDRDRLRLQTTLRVNDEIVGELVTEPQAVEAPQWWAPHKQQCNAFSAPRADCDCGATA